MKRILPPPGGQPSTDAKRLAFTRELLEALPSCTRVLARQMYGRDVPPRTLALLMEHLPAARIAIWVRSRSRSALVLAGAHGLDRTIEAELPIVDERSHGHGSVPDPILVDLGLELVVPCLYDQLELGLLAVGGFDQDLVRELELFLEAIGLLVAGALVNASALESFVDSAHTDPLTRLANRRFVDEELARAIRDAERASDLLSVILFDIDHFKRLNDTHGHAAGDRALVRVADLLRAHFRTSDLCARWGGEEFLVLLRRTPPVRALELANRFRRVVEREPFEGGATQPGGFVTVSGGVASFPADGTTPQALAEQADRCLYEAKAAGRNRIVGRPTDTTNGGAVRLRRSP